MDLGWCFLFHSGSELGWEVTRQNLCRGCDSSSIVKWRGNREKGWGRKSPSSRLTRRVKLCGRCYAANLGLGELGKVRSTTLFSFRSLRKYIGKLAERIIYCVGQLVWSRRRRADIPNRGLKIERGHQALQLSGDILLHVVKVWERGESNGDLVELVNSTIGLSAN